MTLFRSASRRHAFLSILLVLAAGAAGAAEPQGRPAPELLSAWTEFASRAPEPPAVTWSRRSGAPESVFGRLSPVSAEAREPAARRFLAENAGLFRLPLSTADLPLASEVGSPMGRHFTFRQTYRGVPVFGAEVKVHFNADGEIIGVNNTAVPDVALESVRPSIRARDAVQAARSAAPAAKEPAELGAPKAELGIYAEDGAVLAWKVILPTGGPTWQVFVDAQTGDILAGPTDINRYAQGTGQVFRINAVVATHDNGLTDQNDSASAVPAGAYTVVTLPGLEGNGFLDGVFASSAKTKKRASSASNTFVFDRANDGFSETMGYYYLDYSQRYIQSLGFATVNNRQQVFSVNRFKGDNSFYSPQSQEITYGTGGVDDAEDADVIWHEYGHSIQDNQVPGFGSTLEAGSMGEGFGDYWAGTLGAQLSGGFQDACLAEWDATSYSGTNPPCLRRLDGTKHYPQDVAGEVHADGEIWSAALWQVRGTVGAAKADKAILQAHFLLSANATFNQGANALVTAAIQLGFSSRDVASIRTILRDRGFTVTA